MVKLSTRTHQKITLAESLKQCASVLSKGGIALLYSPSQCQFAKIQSNGTLTDSEEKEINLKDIFEVRAFNQNSELRWLNQSNGEGQAVLISEEDNISDYLADCLPNLEAIDVIKQKYLLWGEGVKSISKNPGWGKLAESRIGKINVPVELTPNQRVYLNAIEYLQADNYGNVSVVEERLISLEVKS